MFTAISGASGFSLTKVVPGEWESNESGNIPGVVVKYSFRSSLQLCHTTFCFPVEAIVGSSIFFPENVKVSATLLCHIDNMCHSIFFLSISIRSNFFVLCSDILAFRFYHYNHKCIASLQCFCIVISMQMYLLTIRRVCFQVQSRCS